MPVRYGPGLNERVVRLLENDRADPPKESRSTWQWRVHGLTGIPIDAMRNLANGARVDAEEKPRLAAAVREEIKALERELAEVKRANELLKLAGASFAAAEFCRNLKSSCRASMRARVYSGLFGLEPICSLVRDHNAIFAPST